ncbi:radical SAM family heme chaperone HemW [Cypionkella sp.]|jgi:putative oxygen-independent coproporphyrinogen III oxidase|uniref:radical SAM family heme chaperone HemW n=1 Tax=Cypionkella sp. TaxID=2811411 RepID=UPI0027201DB7|nr:radical SAM family heme chaperone HemW [Cypionkella sp.]MDO8984900.1 radical SAM family heme chaperone HemW [Cypionkella sp.]MDP2048984.1 radical SAM family heme chaperone HemW [Cypionkella sp.]
MEDWQHGGFGLYLHWPYCESKCPYCDFNSHVASHIDQKQWQHAYLSEIDRLGQETHGRILNSVFFGGGTPSLMEPELVAAIIERIRATWPMSNDPEITLEANPGSVEAGRFHGFQQAGVTRVSMGMQAMNDEDLRRLGRKHSAEEARKAFEIARNCFDRVSFDLIYARQDQSLATWRDELGKALELAIDHLSLYQLTIEDGTAFADRFAKGGLRGLPSEDLAADMFELTQELCDKAGLPAYEVSNHAKSGCESRHNLIYWRGGDYVGIGPGAHGRLTLLGTRWATEALKSPVLWLGMVQSGKVPELPRSALTAEEHSLEYLLMSLRLSEGLDLARYQTVSGTALNAQKIRELSNIGMVEIRGDRLRTTPNGRMVLNAVLRDLATA